MLFIIVVSSLFTLRAVTAGLIFLGSKDNYKARTHALACAIATALAIWGWSSL